MITSYDLKHQQNSQIMRKSIFSLYILVLPWKVSPSLQAKVADEHTFWEEINILLAWMLD